MTYVFANVESIFLCLQLLQCVCKSCSCVLPEVQRQIWLRCAVNVVGEHIVLAVVVHLQVMIICKSTLNTIYMMLTAVALLCLQSRNEGLRAVSSFVKVTVSFVECDVNLNSLDSPHPAHCLQEVPELTD